MIYKISLIFGLFQFLLEESKFNTKTIVSSYRSQIQLHILLIATIKIYIHLLYIFIFST